MRTSSNLRKAKLIEQLELPVPSLPEQERIVRILDEAEALRRLRAERTSEQQRNGSRLISELFGAPARNRGGWGHIGGRAI